jgi:hypothetical protein
MQILKSDCENGVYSCMWRLVQQQESTKGKF